MKSREVHAYPSVRRHYELTYEPGTGRFAHAVDARISPDGDRVAFTGTLTDDLDSGAYTRVGLASHGRVQTLTSGPNDDHDPRWSPDGRVIGFLSDRVRAGQPQLLLLDTNLDAVRATPWVDGVVEYFEWAPDGRSLVFTSEGRDPVTRVSLSWVWPKETETAKTRSDLSAKCR